MISGLRQKQSEGGKQIISRLKKKYSNKPVLNCSKEPELRFPSSSAPEKARSHRSVPRTAPPYSTRRRREEGYTQRTRKNPAEGSKAKAAAGPPGPLRRPSSQELSTIPLQHHFDKSRGLDAC